MSFVTVLYDDALQTFHIIPTADQRFTADANLRESAGVRIREKMKLDLLPQPRPYPIPQAHTPFSVNSELTTLRACAAGPQQLCGH
jgi:hypothetical protein